MFSLLWLGNDNLCFRVEVGVEPWGPYDFFLIERLKKYVIWPCSFQQENLVKFEEKLLILNVKKKIDFCIMWNAFLALGKQHAPYKLTGWSLN